MARKRERIFAGFGAFLFLASACTLTIFVIFSGSSSPATPDTTAQTCTDNGTEATLTAPVVTKGATPFTTLQKTDLTTGTGAAAKDGDCLIVKYYGAVASTGAKFQENFTQPSAFAFTLGQGQVITGWDNGLVGMKVGGERQLDIPAAQAYGDQAQSGIPANSDLIFVVKLLRIQKS